MSATDPISDLLTRVRNGLQADHDAVEIPASRIKVEVARILTEQGYVESYSVEPGRIGQTLRVTLKYTEDRKPVIDGHAASVAPRPAHLRLRRRGAAGAGRHGHGDRLDVARRDDRATTPAAPAWAASWWRRSGSP